MLKCPKSAKGHHKPVKEQKYNGTKWYRNSSQPEVVETRIRCIACSKVLDYGTAQKTAPKKHTGSGPDPYQF
ncbi:MAG: hypothetical protein M3M85_01195 [bacterium]|nr:hypothetical protein [bacterium]